MRVLCVVAHPDDETLMCGGTLAKHVAAGDPVDVAICTNGVGAREAATQEDDAARYREHQAAMEVLGARRLAYAGYPDNQMDTLPLLMVVRFVEGLLEKYRPEVVYTHHPDDMNVDHAAVSRAVEVATRPWSEPGRGVRAVYMGEVPGSTRPGFAPTRWVGLTGGHVSRREEALRCYESEQRLSPHPRSWAGSHAVLCARGTECGCDWAEGFVVLRERWL